MVSESFPCLLDSMEVSLDLLVSPGGSFEFSSQVELGKSFPLLVELTESFCPSTEFVETILLPIAIGIRVDFFFTVTVELSGDSVLVTI